MIRGIFLLLLMFLILIGVLALSDERGTLGKQIGAGMMTGCAAIAGGLACMRRDSVL